MNPDPITVPFREGMKARAAGKTMSENPYPHSRRTEQPRKAGSVGKYFQSLPLRTSGQRGSVGGDG